jgi:hemolysin III
VDTRPPSSLLDAYPPGVTPVAETPSAVTPAPPIHDERPTWRGRTHTWAFFAAIPAGVALVTAARGAAATASAAIFAVGLLCVFGTSAAYHRLARGDRARLVMQRLDHSMIYLLIAASYVPICIVALPGSWGIPMLSIVGALGLLGITLKLIAPRRGAWIGFALYPVMGWCALAAAPALVTHLTATQLVLVVAGGVAYTVGFPVLLTRWPDPWPRTFGYHEVWHVFTVVAACLHFGAVASLVV